MDRDVMSTCAHCYHVEDRDDCRKYGIWKKKVEQCCKCGQTQQLQRPEPQGTVEGQIARAIRALRGKE